MSTKAKKAIVKQVSLDGTMTFGQLRNGLHAADFQCNESVELDQFKGKCQVQIMHDGSVYIVELRKYRRNKALFRDDNCSLTLGRDGRYYFTFSMPQDQAWDLPGSLVIQANNIAEKFMKDLMGNY